MKRLLAALLLACTLSACGPGEDDIVLCETRIYDCVEGAECRAPEERCFTAAELR